MEEKYKQECSLCGKKVVPTIDNENHCSVEITHHYGSPKDGDILLYDVCIGCVETLFGEAIALKKRSIWDNYVQQEEKEEDKKTDWLKWAMEIASEWNLEEEVKSCYNKHIAEGYSEEESANMALYDWDI